MEGREEGSMGVEHVLRECTYECNMMSSPFYHASLRPPSLVWKRGVCKAEATLGQAVCVSI